MTGFEQIDSSFFLSSTFENALLTGVLVKLFDDRQLRVGEPVVTYLAARIERSIAVARDVVDALDRASLSGKRPISVPLAAEILRDKGLG
mgnify:CR=1 FL=1